MILLFIVWCLCRSAAIADSYAQELELKKNNKKGGKDVCIL